MLDMVAQHPLLDLVCYGVLLYAFHYCVYRSPRGCALIAVIALGKVVHTCGVGSEAFANTGFNLALFACLWLGLYLTRQSPNFFWLFSGLLAIKLVDISLNPWQLEQGEWLYLWLIAADVAALVLLDQRNQWIRWLARHGRGYPQHRAQIDAPYQRVSYQEVALMVIYWASIVINVLMLSEDILYRYTDFSPSLMFTAFPYVKLPLNLLELVVLFNIATGHAIDLVRRDRVW